MNLKIYINISTLLFLIICSLNSCNSSVKKQTNRQETSIIKETEHFISDTLRMYEGMPSNILKGARISQNICKIKLYYFSNNKSKDTFKLQIPKGEIEYSNANASIVNSNGKIIYSIVFPTCFLMNGYDFMPEIPQNLDSKGQELFLKNHEKTLSRGFYEKYFSKEINDFLVKCVFQAKKDDYFFDIQYCLDKDLREEMLNSKNLICVYFPIHHGEEGTSYIGYSSKKKRANVFAETD